MDFWGPEYVDTPDYPQALRHFIRYELDSIPAIRRLAGEQAQRERQWASGRLRLVEARVDATKLGEYDRRVLKEAHEWAEELSTRLAALNMPLFRPGASIEARTQFLGFLSDLVRMPPR